MTRVLFVCLGNICRSPLAHGVLRDLVDRRGLEDRIQVDSCGTSAHHRGQSPDPNMIRVAQGHGLDISELRSRPLAESDGFEFDLLVPMDASNERDVRARLLPNARPEVARFTSFVDDAVFSGAGVPDPYWGGVEGFEQVHRIIVDGCERVLERALELGQAP